MPFPGLDPLSPAFPWLPRRTESRLTTGRLVKSTIWAHFASTEMCRSITGHFVPARTMKFQILCAFVPLLACFITPKAWAQEPSVEFSVSPAVSEASTNHYPFRARFDASKSISQTWSVTNYYGITDFVWSFGDGSTVITKQPTLEHVFLWEGEFNVSLTVSNSARKTATGSSMIRLTAPDPSFNRKIYHIKPSGHDSKGSGTLAKPWATISKALGAVSGGDYVAVHPGVYNEYSDIRRDVASTRDRVHLIGYSATTGGFKIRAPNYTIDGFDLNFANLSAQGAIFIFEQAHNTWVLNNTIRDGPIGRSAIYVAGDSIPDQEPSSGCLNGLIHNNRMQWIRWICVEIVNGMNWKITANQVFHTTQEGDFIRPQGEGHLIADNFCFDLQNGGTGGHADFVQLTGQNGFQARHITIERNTCVGIPGDPNQAQICQTATFGLPYTNIVFRNNQFIYVRGQANAHGDGFKFHNNLFFRCGPDVGHVIALGGPNGSCIGTEIKNNIFFECGKASSGTSGWYENGLSPWATNVTVAADHNFVTGLRGASKLTAPPVNPFRWGIPGQEVHGINGGDPKFEDPENLGFRIVSGSPLLGKGTPLADSSESLDGQPRKASWSIGPQEISTATAGLPPNKPTGVRVVEVSK